MFYFQLIIEEIVFLTLLFFLVLILRKFDRKDLLSYFLLPLILFVVGFTMRLNSNPNFIDLGFFFTEISNLWLYILFVIVLMLGQIKYWKK